MCGISGCIVRQQRNEAPALLSEILASQAKRGPDATAAESFAFRGRQLWLGHNRLSIIDLSAAANQPMTIEHGRYVIVFNGAIYNYVELRAELVAAGKTFATECDTEVLVMALATWGPSALGKLYGMFALALYDRDAQTLLLARDRFGVKPLYFCTTENDDLWFASMPHVIARARDAQPDMEYVTRGIRLKYYEDESEISPYEGVGSVKPGHYLVFGGSRSGAKQVPFYDLSRSVAEERAWRSNGSTRALAVRKIRETLEDATRIRLRADVPIGISLSSGVDSSAINGLCAELGTKLHGFCFGNPNDETSEAPLVAKLAAHYGQPITFVEQSTGPVARTLFWRTLRAQGAPFPHTSQMAQYAVFERARSDGVKVMLGGQGGDEAFMGYRKFFLYQARRAMARRDGAALLHSLSNAIFVAPSILMKARLFWGERKRYSGKSGDGLHSQLMLPSLTKSASPGMGIGGEPTDRQILDITRFSLPSLLRYEDRNSMANSIESRLPFLDHRVIELGVVLPANWKLSRGFGKFALRESMRGVVPDWVVFRRDKRGFDTRHADWIGAGVGEEIRAGLAIHSGRARGYLGGRDPERFFSDRELAANPARFAEATSLLWLLDPRLESYPAS